MNNKAPWHARLARTLAIILPLFLIGAALGTKFGLWGWMSGLTAFSIGGLAIAAITALLAIVSIILVLRKGNRLGLRSAIFAAAVPAAYFAFFVPLIIGAGEHPIHDVATDTASPPAFSETVLAARAQSGANAINDYGVPLSQIELFADVEPPVSEQTHREIIATTYPELKPLALGETSTDAAVNAVQLAMADMNFTNIRYNEELGTVEGLAETFWFGFKDDVVARVADGQIDFRSVSRVGRSDIGANAERIMALREAVEARLSE